MAKKKQKSLKKLKKEWIDWFQIYIRWRDGWECITCGLSIDPFSPTAKQDMHAGHYIGRGNTAMIADEENVNAQCRSCNGKEHWNGDKNTYAIALQYRYGADILDRLEARKHNPTKLNRASMLEDIDNWKKFIDDSKKAW